MEILKDDTLFEAMQKNPNAGEILAELGLHCLGCAMARGETIETASVQHGIDLNLLLEKLNQGI